jgi:dCMP deaminase
MNRIGRHQMLMQIAEVVSRRSTCFRRNVGCVITASHNIVAIGYNGPASGEPHCTGNGCADPVRGCQRAIHAEKNALDRIAMKDVCDGRMYVTESPCPHCAKEIIDSGSIHEVFYLHEYRLAEGRVLIMRAGIKLYRMTPSGYIIDVATGDLVELD